MYHRHSTSSAGSTGSGAPPQHYQQPYPFQRASSAGSRPPSQIYNNSYESQNNSYSSLPDRDDNYYGREDRSHQNYSSTDYNSKYSKRNSDRMNVQAFLAWRILPCLILVVFPWLPNQFLRIEVRSKRRAIETMVREQANLVENLDEMTASIQNLKQEVEILHKDNELSYQELRKNGKTPENVAAGEIDEVTTKADMETLEYEKLEQEEEVLVQRIDRLEKEIQSRAVKRLSEKYGNGQYRFQVNVKDNQGAQRHFVIETAMLAEMPHAIDHFFRMIEKKLWNGLALVHEPHSLVVSATPETADDTHNWAGKRFLDANITHMAFTEHSPTYPPPHHRMYTVAFSGRPGGPGFYISLDNELDYKHEQESTFGVVMEGRDVLYQLFLQKDVGRKKTLTIEGIDILETKRLAEARS